MSEGDFIKYDTECISISNKSFRSLWVLSTLFRKKKHERMKNLTIASKKKELEKSPEYLERFETIKL